MINFIFSRFLCDFFLVYKSVYVLSGSLFSRIKFPSRVSNIVKRTGIVSGPYVSLVSVVTLFPMVRGVCEHYGEPLPLRNNVTFDVSSFS